MTAPERAALPGWPDHYWRCPECGCHSFARIHTRRDDGTYGDGPDVRCVHCKRVFSPPKRIALPGPFHAEEPTRSGDLHAVYEASDTQDSGRVWVGQLTRAAVERFALSPPAPGAAAASLAEVEHLRAELADVSDYAHKLQVALTGCARGGSENFVRHGDGFRADIPFCAAKIDSRFSDMVESFKTELRGRKKAEEEIERLRALLTPAGEIPALIDRYGDAMFDAGVRDTRGRDERAQSARATLDAALASLGRAGAPGAGGVAGEAGSSEDLWDALGTAANALMPFAALAKLHTNTDDERPVEALIKVGRFRLAARAFGAIQDLVEAERSRIAAEDRAAGTAPARDEGRGT